MTERPVGKAVAYGALSVVVYALLFAFEEQFLSWSTRGRWFFLVPVVIAFVFSFVHGGFTGYFWEALGVRAKAGSEAGKKGS